MDIAELTDNGIFELAREAVRRQSAIGYLFILAEECRRRGLTATEDAILRTAADRTLAPTLTHASPGCDRSPLLFSRPPDDFPFDSVGE
jgi:hypothetical protein